MSPTIPEDPIEGGRVYTSITRDRLERLALTDDDYRRAKVLADAFDAGLSPEFKSTLATEGVHLVGFEVLVPGATLEPPFPGVSGDIGLAVVWPTTGGDPPLLSPAVYAFAVQGAAGPVEVAPSLAGETLGSVFVANYTGAAPSPDDWCRKLALTTATPDTGVVVPLSGELVTYDAGGAALLVGLGEVWYAFGGDLTLSGASGDSVTVRYDRMRYRHFEWLVGALGLRSEPAPLGVPEHRAFQLGLGWVPDWSPEPFQVTAGEFTVSGTLSSPTEGLDRYGGALLNHDVGTDREADVKRLQADLWELGFWFEGLVDGAHRGSYDWVPGNRRMLTTAHADGVYGTQTEWAVREFQAYAARPAIARHTSGTDTNYANNLEQVANTSVYRGPIDGELDGRTAALVRLWLENDWRCPVVVEARSGDDWQTVEKENVWNRETVPNDDPRVFARDVAKSYPVPTDRQVTVGGDDPEPGYRITLGQTERSTGGGIGPLSLRRYHVWPEGEMTPEHLAGVDRATLAGNDSLHSTYKVVRAMADRENEGFFDVINGWDAQVISLGPYHWILTIGRGADVLDAGELGGYMSFFKEQELAAFESGFRSYGLDIAEAWDGDGSDLRTSPGKYESQFQLPYPDGVALVKNGDRDYLRNWHWFYRWIMATRVSEPFRRRMWDMARLRLEGLLGTDLPANEVADVPTDDGRTRRARIGDVFRSELAVALLLRWHVYRPAHVTGGTEANAVVTEALADAREQVASNNVVNYTGNPLDWPETVAYGEPLAEGIIRPVGAGDVDTPNAEVQSQGFRTRTSDGVRRTYDMYLHRTDGWVAVQETRTDASSGNQLGQDWERYAGAVARVDLGLDADTRYSVIRSLNAMRSWPNGARFDAENHQAAIAAGNDNFYETMAPAAAGGQRAGRLDAERGLFSLHDDGLDGT